MMIASDRCFKSFSKNMRRNFFIQSHVDFFNIRHAAAQHNDIWIENINEHGKGARQSTLIVLKCHNSPLIAVPCQ